MVDILVPLIVFMTPVLLYFTRNYFRLKEKQLELAAQGRQALAGSERGKHPPHQRTGGAGAEPGVGVIALDGERGLLPGRSQGNLAAGERSLRQKLLTDKSAVKSSANE